MEGQLFALFWKGNPKIWGKCRTWKIPSLLERELIETWKFQQTWEFQRYPNEYMHPCSRTPNIAMVWKVSWQIDKAIFSLQLRNFLWESGFRPAWVWMIHMEWFLKEWWKPQTWPNIINLYSSKIWRKVFDFQVYTLPFMKQPGWHFRKRKEKKHVSHSIIHHYLVGLLWIPTKMAIS